MIVSRLLTLLLVGLCCVADSVREQRTDLSAQASCTQDQDIVLSDPSRGNRSVQARLCMPQLQESAPLPGLIVFAAGAGLTHEDYSWICDELPKHGFAVALQVMYSVMSAGYDFNSIYVLAASTCAFATHSANSTVKILRLLLLPPLWIPGTCCGGAIVTGIT